MVTLIIPAAANVTSNQAGPTWSLRHPNGRCVLIEAIAGLDLTNVTRLIVVVLREHVVKYLRGDVSGLLLPLFDPHTAAKVSFLELDAPTHSGPETVVAAITHFGVTGPIFVKDPDGRFDACIEKGNVVYVLHVTEATIGGLQNICSKSFIENNGQVVTNIVEKHMISNVVCVGGYGFESAELFTSHVQKVKSTNPTRRVYVSHIVYSMMLDGGATFFAKFIETEFHDWKTPTGWLQYCSKFRNLFVHIEGIVVVTDPGTPFWTPIDQWQPNLTSVKTLQQLRQGGQMRIILTTERPSSERAKVTERLRDLHVPFDDIVFNMLCASHCIVNDFLPSTGYPTALGVSVPSNCQDLSAFLPRVPS